MTYLFHIDIVCEIINKQDFIKRKLTSMDILQKSTILSSKLEIDVKLNRNKNIICDIDSHDKKLTLFQEPIIKKITEAKGNGILILPCGGGKTYIAVSVMKNLFYYGGNIIICCPTSQIQCQWYDTISQLLKHRITDIYLLGQIGSTHIDKDCQNYIIITTYTSSKILTILASKPDLTIFDEAHHMAGIYSEEEGSTREIMDKNENWWEANILSLTFTPRYVTSDKNYYTMDNKQQFGEILCNISLREMIDVGLLPDYKIWILSSKK